MIKFPKNTGFWRIFHFDIDLTRPRHLVISENVKLSKISDYLKSMIFLRLKILIQERNLRKFEIFDFWSILKIQTFWFRNDPEIFLKNLKTKSVFIPRVRILSPKIKKSLSVKSVTKPIFSSFNFSVFSTLSQKIGIFHAHSFFIKTEFFNEIPFYP